MKRLTYADSGVDIRAEERAISAMKRVMTGRRKGIGAPLTEIGHYAGLIDMGEYAIAMTTDGVGSKVLIASAMRKWDTVGIDCMAMNVNDLLAIGAEPLAFVDYLALEKVDPEMTAQIAIGLERGAEIANVSIVGGETASLPEIIRGFDLAGTCIGMIKKKDVITGERIEKGDVVIGLPSSGLHSNGFSLARKIVEESGYTYFDKMPYSKKTIGEELLEPTRIYMEALAVVQKADVHGMAHITGGGLPGNLNRVLPKDCDAWVRKGSWPVPPVFDWLGRAGDLDREDMYSAFNMGIGFVGAVEAEQADQVVRTIERLGEKAYRIGEIRKGEGKVRLTD